MASLLLRRKGECSRFARMTVWLRPTLDGGSFGFLFMFADIALWIWGGNPMTLPKPAWFTGSIELGDRMYPTYRLFLIAIGLAVGVALWWFQERTRVGAMLRAGVDDEETARGL